MITDGNDLVEEGNESTRAKTLGQSASLTCKVCLSPGASRGQRDDDGRGRATR
jgi:hypothetical protein